MISSTNGASGLACVNRHSAKSMSPIAVPDVIPKIKRFSPSSSSREGVVEVVDPPSASATGCSCKASRYRCPTGVLTLPAAPLNGGTKPGIDTMANYVIGCHESFELLPSIADRETSRNDTHTQRERERKTGWEVTKRHQGG
jgi:hypothetical protein